MHVATTTVDKMLDYVMHTLPILRRTSAWRSAASLISKNPALPEKVVSCASRAGFRQQM
jgi:hypothetical protein